MFVFKKLWLQGCKWGENKKWVIHTGGMKGFVSSKVATILQIWEGGGFIYFQEQKRLWNNHCTLSWRPANEQVKLPATSVTCSHSGQDFHSGALTPLLSAGPCPVFASTPCRLQPVCPFLPYSREGGHDEGLFPLLIPEQMCMNKNSSKQCFLLCKICLKTKVFERKTFSI